MAEPIGITAGILAFITTAYSSTQALYETIQDFRHAPKDIQDILKDLDALRGTLSLLEQKVHLLKDTTELEVVLKGCATACSEFNKVIKESIKHGKDESPSTRDVLTWTFKGKKESKDFKLVLASYKQTLAIVVNIETLTVSIEGIKDTKLSLSDLGEMLNKHYEDIIERIDTLILAGVNNENPVVQGLEAQKLHINQCKVLCEKTDQILDGYLVQKFGNVRIGESGKGFVGAANTNTHSSVNQTFGDIEIGEMGNGMIGWVDEHSLQAFVNSNLEQEAKHSATTEGQDGLSSSAELIVTKQPQMPQDSEETEVPVLVATSGLKEENHVEDGDEVQVTLQQDHDKDLQDVPVLTD